jgi:hypothetical protein
MHECAGSRDLSEHQLEIPVGQLAVESIICNSSIACLAVYRLAYLNLSTGSLKGLIQELIREPR